MPESNSNLNISANVNDAESGLKPSGSMHSLASEQMAAKYDKLVRMYTYQLTIGCEDENCDWKLCHSCNNSLKLNPSASAVTAIQLAGKSKYYFCPRLREKFLVNLESTEEEMELPKSISEQILEMGKASNPSTSPKPVKKSTSKPFLYSMLGSSAFSQIFQPNRTPSSPKFLRGQSADQLRTDFLQIPKDEIRKSKSIEVLSTLEEYRPDDSPQPKPYIDFIREADMSKDNTPIPTPALSKRSTSALSGLGIEWFDQPPKPMAPDELPNHFTLSMIQDWHGQVSLNAPDLLERDTILQKMYETVQRIFEDSIALNHSWLNPEAKHPSQLDLYEVRESYDRLLLFDGTSFERIHMNNVMAEAMDVLLSRLETNPRFIHHSNASVQLRQILILLEYPFLNQGSMELLGRLIAVISGMRSRTKQVLINWFSLYPAPALENLITNVVQPYITLHTKEASPTTDKAQLTGIRMLQLLYLANEAAASRSKQGPLVPLELFYNQKVSAGINAREEVKKFQKLVQDVTSGLDKMDNVADDSTISYLQYGFLLDPPCKLRLIRSSAMFRMLTEVEEAFVTTSVIMQAAKFFQNESISQLEASLKDATNPFLVLRISRENLVESTLQQLTDKTKDLLKPLRVAFTSGEEGVDMGGVQKEFFAIIIDALMDPAKGMFSYDEDTRISWINGFSLEDLVHFELVGQIIGLSLYNGVQIDLKFPKLFYKKLLGEKPTLYDVQDAFPALGHGLQQLLDWDPSQGDVEDVYCRSFEISYDVYGEVKTFDLIPNGSSIPVTNDNRQDFVDRYVDHLVNKSVAKQFSALRKGFNKVCGSLALQVCRAEELEQMICGSREFNINDLISKARYDGYSADSPTIVDFWSVVQDMTLEQKKSLLEFATGSSRVPLKGLGDITFVIQNDGRDDSRLPKAHTCFGTLLLPQYSTREILQEKLLSAIENSRGFGLM